MRTNRRFTSRNNLLQRGRREPEKLPLWKSQCKHSQCYSTNKVFQISDQDKRKQLSINLSSDDQHQCLGQHESISSLRKKIWNEMEGFVWIFSLFRLHTKSYRWIFLLKLHFQKDTCMLSFIAISRLSQYFPNLDRNIYCPSTDGNLKAIIIITKPWDLFKKLLHMSFTAQNTSLHFKLSFVLTHQWPKYNSFLFNFNSKPSKHLMPYLQESKCVWIWWLHCIFFLHHIFYSLLLSFGVWLLSS